MSAPKAVATAKGGARGAAGPSDEEAPGATLDPAAAKLIDEAMAAEQDRDFRKATDLLLKVQKDFPHVRDLDFRLASLALEQNDAAKALPLLNRSINEGEQMSASYKMRGYILNRKGGISRGMNDFESATLTDPFSAESFYFWGEALRRAGKPQAALIKLQQAMDRLREPVFEAEYRLKIRLTQIELGEEKEFAPEMAARLAENPPPPDWLLTAAAIQLQKHNVPEAAKFLEGASQLMDRDLFSYRMGDYFFSSYRFEKPLAKYFAILGKPPASTRVVPTTTAAPSNSPAPAASSPPWSPAGTPPALPTGTP